MHAQNTIHPSTSLPSRFFRGLRAATAIVVSTLVLSACDQENLGEPSIDDAVIIHQDEAALEIEIETLATVDELMSAPEAVTLQLWLESQGFAMVSSDLDLVSSESDSDSLNTIVQFAAPGSDLIGAAIAFRLSAEGEILEVGAIIGDQPDPTDELDIATCLSPAVYHANDGAVEITAAPQEAGGCQVGIFGCGRCLTSGGCALQQRESYYWGVKFNTCDSCGGTNPNGCCGCLPGYNC